MDSGKADDKFLWGAIKYKDDESALEILFRRYYVKLSDFSQMMVKDHCEAGEIAADVFVKIWEKRNQLEITHVRAYLYMSAKNMSVNHLKVKSKNLTFENIEALNQEVISVYHDPFQLICDIEEHQYYNHLINQLPSQRKIIYKLNRNDGLKYKEIAEVLKISIRSVEDQMMHAMKFLRAAYRGTDVIGDNSLR